MKVLRLSALTAATIAASLVAQSSDARHHRHEQRELGTEVLGEEDGWASDAPGTSGGALAAPEQVYIVTSRAELIAALNDGVPATISPTVPSNAPKIIYVEGTIDLNVDDAGEPLSCEDYYRDGYDPAAFAAAFDPAVYGLVAPVGPLEAARAASRLVQQARVRIRVGSNTTLVGVGDDATLRGVWLDISGTAAANVSSIIVRNITFEDTFDCFTVWDPTDGALGNWNAAYDAISLRNANHVWIDHNTFRDRTTADENQPPVFGRPYQVHDGLVDITNGSDLVTVSFNIFDHHDKTMLIGSSDTAVADRGKLRVTLHHNWFHDTGQRTPRVRFGQLDVYNNYYDYTDASLYGYTWGAGVESGIYAENNFFSTPDALTPDRLIRRFGGTTLFEAGTLVNGRRARHRVDVVAAYNTVNDPDLSEEVGWVPPHRAVFHATRHVPSAVERQAGPFDW